jgi:hypothetical protein
VDDRLARRQADPHEVPFGDRLRVQRQHAEVVAPAHRRAGHAGAPGARGDRVERRHRHHRAQALLAVDFEETLGRPPMGTARDRVRDTCLDPVHEPWQPQQPV